jgi:L-seryl-tRNA(Ser) seleniumtransferase
MISVHFRGVKLTEAWRQKLYRGIPNVDDFLEREIVRHSLDEHPRWAVLQAVRDVLENRRLSVAALTTPEDDTVFDTASQEEDFVSLLVAHSRPHLQPLINATGIIVHTNLGRSPLPPDVLEHAAAIAGGYSNLEYDVPGGLRGSRQDHVASLLCSLTGAEAALAVNNNAAAVLLSLDTLASGRQVIVSRGQLVEIGGSFRIPDVMTKSGALLREVGTTNKTHLADYRNAVGEETALLLKVHTSNFQVVGFTSSVDLAELAALGKEHSLPVMDDLGSGSLVDLSPFGLHGEPTVQSAVAAGADIVTFSGDKLLGGPQAGLIVGRREYIDRIRANPLHRAVRIDKLTLASLEATLRIYLDGDRAFRKIPTLRMISEPLADVRSRARKLHRRLSPGCRQALDASVIPCTAQVGGGALPLHEIPSAAVALGGEKHSAHRLEGSLRSLATPVVARIHEGRLLLDMRTVDESEVAPLAVCVESIAPA